MKKPSEYPLTYTAPEEFTIFFEPKESSLDFTAIEHAGSQIELDGSEIPVFDSFDSEYPTHPDLADYLMQGYIKWDGCVNVLFQEGYVHFCSASSAARVGLILAKVYEFAELHLTSFDKELAQ